jgi:hypothetical protein
MEIVEQIVPALELIRGIILKVAEFIAKLFSVNAENIYLILLILISLWGSKKILSFFYTTLEGRISYLLILAGIIFWLLKYFNIN